MTPMELVRARVSIGIASAVVVAAACVLAVGWADAIDDERAVLDGMLVVPEHQVIASKAQPMDASCPGPIPVGSGALWTSTMPWKAPASPSGAVACGCPGSMLSVEVSGLELVAPTGPRAGATDWMSDAAPLGGMSPSIADAWDEAGMWDFERPMIGSGFDLFDDGDGAMGLKQMDREGNVVRVERAVPRRGR